MTMRVVTFLQLTPWMLAPALWPGGTVLGGHDNASGNVSAINAVDADPGTVAGVTKVAGMTSNELAAYF
jgi:hypothetical protein